MRILVTGGAGYIGTHTLLELLNKQHEICVYDNYSNGSNEALVRVAQISGAKFQKVEADIRDKDMLTKTFQEFHPEIVIHLAGLKAVGDSIKFPLEYYENNVQGTISLLKAMDSVKCRRIVFSSSATVYGEPQYLPFNEQHPRAPINPYGRCKYFIEDILNDWVAVNSISSAVILRYFNPVGNHASGNIGEDPNNTPNNLMPYILQVAAGNIAKLGVFGNDYDTRDGTGERDYIHVVDLAHAHARAVDYSARAEGVEVINIGTGRGVTVFEVIQAFEKVTGCTVPYNVLPRRPGDVATSYADTAKAHELLGWRAKAGMDEMCRDSWEWFSSNPNGYVH